MKATIVAALLVAASLLRPAAGASEPITVDFGPDPLERFAAELAAVRLKNGISALPPADLRELTLHFERSRLRPGERWLEGEIWIPAAQVDGAAFTVEVFGLGERTPAFSTTIPVGRARGRLAVDLRRLGFAEARLAGVLTRAGARLGVAEARVSAEATEPVAAGTRVPIHLDAPWQGRLPGNTAVTFGVPFAAGVLWDVGQLRLVDERGGALPCQTEVTGRWAREGSIQWVRFDAVVPPAGKCFVEVGAASAGRPPTAIRLTETAGSIVVETGGGRYVIDSGASPISEVQVGATRITSSGTRGLYLVDHDGNVASASAEGATLIVEARGPLVATLRCEGFYRTARGEPRARHITRLEFVAGDPGVRIQHTLIITEDTNRTWFTEVGWELGIAPGATSATFATARDDPDRRVSVPLDDSTASAWMLQDRHFRFRQDRNHFAVARANARNEIATVLEGEECGDWFAVTGSAGGIGWSCRDAARQHPKEFEARADRVTLRLFSSRGGEQLDFRMAALVPRWNLEQWYKDVLPSREIPNVAKHVAAALAIEQTAIGWSKTHDLLFRPLAAGEPVEAMAGAARRHSEPLYARADEQWIYRSGVMGPLHPRDPKNFPAVEAAIDGSVNYWHARIHAHGEYGFIDYYAGPHISYRGDWPNYRRYHGATYALRPGLWRLYARSGQRTIRELAERSNLNYGDRGFAHWDGGGRRRGLFLSLGDGGDNPGTSATLPLYWQARTTFEISGSTDLDQFLHFYHLTGNRRARDVVLQYAEAAKRDWTPALMRRASRVIMAARCFAQAYRLTWDPVLKAMTEATIDVFTDPGGEIGLTKDRPYTSSTYKTQTDIAGLFDLEEILGSPKVQELAAKIAQWIWIDQLGNLPLGYNNPVGRVGHYVYGQTRNASIPEVLAQQLRLFSALYDPATGLFRGGLGAHTMIFHVQGVPYAQDLLRRTAGWASPAASWLAFDNTEAAVALVVQKPDREAVTIEISFPADYGQTGKAGGMVTVRPLAPPSVWGQDLTTVLEDSNGYAKVRLPTDAPGGAYEIVPARRGKHLVIADRRVPLVLEARNGWKTAFPQVPPVRWYFDVPADAKQARIRFGGSARLFDPSGEAFSVASPGKDVELPAGRPGLWSFEAAEEQAVAVENLPAYFALRDIASYFNPAAPPPKRPLAGTSASAQNPKR